MKKGGIQGLRGFNRGVKSLEGSRPEVAQFRYLFFEKVASRDRTLAVLLYMRSDDELLLSVCVVSTGSWRGRAPSGLWL